MASSLRGARHRRVLESLRRTSFRCSDNPIDYAGWFLQRPDRIPSTNGGLFFFSCTERDDRCVVHLQLRESGDVDELWEAVRNVAAGFEWAAISCGNCEFSAQQWREHLATGWLPGS